MADQDFDNLTKLSLQNIRSLQIGIYLILKRRKQNRKSNSFEESAFE